MTQSFNDYFFVPGTGLFISRSKLPALKGLRLDVLLLLVSRILLTGLSDEIECSIVFGYLCIFTVLSFPEHRLFPGRPGY